MSAAVCNASPKWSKWIEKMIAEREWRSSVFFLYATIRTISTLAPRVLLILSR